MKHATHTLQTALLAAFLTLAATVQAAESPTWRIHLAFASDPLGGTLLDTRDGLAAELDYNDVFGRSNS